MSLSTIDRAVRGAVYAGALCLFGATLVRCAASSDSSGSGGSGHSGGSGNSGGSSASGGFGAVGSAGFSGTGGGVGIDVQSQDDYSPDQFYVNDPPPADCSDAGTHTPTPGGTPDCPSDKNYAGCPCTAKDTTASCWPGKRKNQNKGACKDGTTTCTAVGENKLVWGTCQGFTGIDPNTGLPTGTSGKAACTCFSSGYWHLDNLSPCFYTSGGNTVVFAVSTIPDSSTPPQYQCPQGMTAQSPAPSQAFSPNQVTADCTGFFKLCFTLKAYGTVNGSPQPTDCSMKQICTEAYYSTANQAQSFPDLQSWITDPSELSCAQQFVTNGGYAEMSVDGTSDDCDKVQKVFQTVNYCPFKCSDPANAQDPQCVNCSNGAGGPF